MALDAVFLQAVTEELRNTILGLRIEKIYQPARDQVVLLLRGNIRLLLSAGANAPRIQITHLVRDNPAQPPMFCMLLRKYISGGQITALFQPPLERLIKLEIDTIDALGRLGKYTLILETMGRRSNLILLDEEGRIIDCLRRIDAEMSVSRQLLPGLYYAPPPSTDRLPITSETEAGFYQKLSTSMKINPEQQLEKFILDHYFGISPLLARELSFRTTGETDSRLFTLNQDGQTRFQKEFQNLIDAIQNNYFTPICLRRDDNKPMEFTCFPILQYGSMIKSEKYLTFSALLDTFYEERERQERARQRGAALIRSVTTIRDRLQRKLSFQQKDYAATQNRDEWRIYGDLITANLYQMTRGQTKLICENFYNGEIVEIKLDPLLTPQQNAAKYYKRYTKAKAAETHLIEQMAIARRDVEYLEGVLEELERSETEQDFIEIRWELEESGFLHASNKKDKAKKSKKGKKESAQRPRIFYSSAGFQILAGRNNRQNDMLTRNAERHDLWFHAKNTHGSHIILCTEGRTPDERSIVEAAVIAAYYSHARESGNVPVDYTPVRNVKKMPGARPGMVIYYTYHTVNVTPEKDILDKLL